jgi:hypothetical protein
MTHQLSHRTAATRHRPPIGPADLDAFLVDDDFDDLLDREIDAIRESLADFRTF